MGAWFVTAAIFDYENDKHWGTLGYGPKASTPWKLAPTVPIPFLVGPVPLPDDDKDFWNRIFDPTIEGSPAIPPPGYMINPYMFKQEKVIQEWAAKYYTLLMANATIGPLVPIISVGASALILLL